jgi:hypothetical protein
MALTQIPAATAGATHNIVSFTSSQTWTVPASAKYVDVLVVGGGTGGRGGFRSTSNSGSTVGLGGGVTVLKNIFLNGTGTVSIVVGAGSNGTAGSATTTPATIPGDAGYSGFGTYAYSQGAVAGSDNPGLPGYKGTGPTYNLNNDSTQSNYAPFLMNVYSLQGIVNADQSNNQLWMAHGLDAIGFRGGYGGSAGTATASCNTAGAMPGYGNPNVQNINIRTNTLPSFDFYNLKTSIVGAGNAGTAGTGGGAGGAGGLAGIAGGGGVCTPTAGQPGGQGGPGAGGGGSWSSPVGGTGGNGGSAGANTGAGGGGGANSGSTTAGTGGAGGNGAAGIVVVHWVS